MLVDPARSQKMTVTVFRSSPAVPSVVSGDPQAEQKREPAVFRAPQLEHVVTNRV